MTATANKIEFDFDSIPTVEKFYRDETFITAIMGPFGSAKSSGCVFKLIRQALKQKPGPDGVARTRWAVIRNTYPQLKDTTIRTFFEWFPPEHCGRYTVHDHKYIITAKQGYEIEILFRALDRPEHVSNLLSLELTGAWVNEAREVPGPVINALQGRVGRYPAARAGGPTWWGIFLDSNPPDDDSWWYQTFEERMPDNVRLYKQPGGLDPKAENKKNLPPGYYENLVKTYSQEEARVYVHGQYGFIQDGKPVYPDYDDNVHCRPTPYIPGVPVYRGWDFGLWPACVFVQVPAEGYFRIFDEMLGDNLGADRFSDDVLLHSNREYSKAEFEDVGDPAGEARSQSDEKTCFEILQNKGIQIQTGIQTVQIRLEAVKKALNTLVQGRPMLQVDPKCKAIRKGFQGRYRFRKIQVAGIDEKFTEKPEKNKYSHPHDALQYVAAHLLGPGLTTRQDYKPLDYSRINAGVV